MARVATKSPGQREDEEVERLVRPAPRKKPPRHDRRRETMKPEQETDPDLKGKDTSLNYKVIGGSTVERLVNRYLVRRAADATEPPKPPRPRKKSDTIPARSKETGEKVYITRETLKSEPQKYEKWEAKKQQAPGDASQPGEAPSPGSSEAARPPPQPAGPEAQNPPQAPAQPSGQLQPGGEPKAPAEPARKPKNERDPEDGAGNSKKPKGGKGAKPGGKKSPQTPAEKHRIPAPKQREVTAAEQEEATLFLADNLPPKVAAKLIAEGIHPDDAKVLVNHFNAAMTRPLGNPAALAERAAAFFQTNASKVEPPAKWHAADGTEVEFGILPPDIKAAAYREHQLQVVAMSMAVQQQLEEKLSFGGKVSPAVSHTLVRALLGVGAEDTSKIAGEVFESTAELRGSQRISDGLAQRMLGAVEGNKDATRILRAYLEANDYKRAKSVYLGSTGVFTERDDPAKIVEGLRAARDFFTARARAYGEGDDHEGARRFETRTLAQLKKLSPKKYARIRKAIDVEEAKVYDRAKKLWDTYDEKLKAWEDAEESEHVKKVRGKRPQPPPGERPTEPLGYGNARSPDSLQQDGRQLWETILKRSGTKKTAARIATKYLLSSYPSGIPMDEERRKRALYHGIEPSVHYPREPYPRGEQVPARALAETDYSAIFAAAREWLPRVSTPEQAVELAVRSGPYRVDVQTFGELVRRFSASLRAAAGSSFATAQDTNLRETENGVRHMLRLSSEQKGAANEVLGQLDALAQNITANHKKWGMSFEAAKRVVNHLDRIADTTEALVFGEESLRNRQAEVAVLSDEFRQDALEHGLITAKQISKAAKVLQRDSDEPYMDTFKNPMSPIETDSDEPYMSAYGDDQSSAVNDGEDDTGRELAP